MRNAVFILTLGIVLASCTLSPSARPSETPAEGMVILPSNFDLQGHRGARGLKPENTLPAFEAALDLQVTTLELDLHFTVDQVVVIWHDPRIEASKCRLRPDTSIDAPDPDSLIYQGDKLRISNLTFAQLQAYVCDRNPDKGRFPTQDHEPTALAGAEYGIVSLSELFDFVEAYSRDAGKTGAQRENAALVRFNIETKRKPDDPAAIGDGFDGLNAGPFELAILELIRNEGLQERVILQSFDHRSLWAVHSLNEQITLAALTSGGRPSPASYAEQGAAIWSPNYNDLTPALIEQARAAELRIIPWTVNEPQDMLRLIDMGVDGLITDRPDVFLDLILDQPYP